MIIYLSMIDNQVDRDKFEFIYDNYRYTMLYAARGELRDEYLAEDAVQEAFMAIVKNISCISIEDCNKLRRLVVIITKNKAVDIIRKREKGRKKNNLEGEEEIEKTEIIPIDDILDTEEEPAEEVLNKIMSVHGMNRLTEIIKNFDDLYRIPLELSLLYGYNHKEISGILGISENLVRTRIFRGKQQLKQIIMKEME